MLGLLAFLFDPFGGHPELYSTGKIVLAFFCPILMIPVPVIADRGFNLFSFNAPSWSLFWEYVAYIVYAFMLCKIRRGYLLLFLAFIMPFPTWNWLSEPLVVLFYSVRK